ncbi:hypothetical protein OIU34_19190 [Pararhizobium sp. BT-229]|uniref:hypothetical protein n=1 Tax=Pararhizobium sp. BT-229 TaxID=2986923 RepID=UPI0021F6CD31|nr:hypothetical protein [Pararhizobium sp. BT-229]MCV9964008.1 hypothetical protein [Pararhizobium sp. BT-229]
MSNWSKLVAHDPVSRRNKHGNTVRGWFHDIDDVLQPGRKVLREGISATTLHIISVDRERNLVAIMEDGHSVHMNSIEGSRYFSSQILVYRYRTEVVGNEVHVILPFERLFQFPLKEGAR